ncbi:MAG: hypothetical protein ACR2JH_09580 [Solirubrobacteraceae bacterium]
MFVEVGCAGINALWERQIAEQCERRAPESARLVSLGAGNGEMELPLAARLAEQGHDNLELVLLELNPVMHDRAMETRLPGLTRPRSIWGSSPHPPCRLVPQRAHALADIPAVAHRNGSFGLPAPGVSRALRSTGL